MKKTIIILSHANSINSIYCDYVHSHAKALKKLGYNVVVIACVNYFPFLKFLSLNKKKILEDHKGIKIIDDIKIIYKKKLSFSKFLYNTNLNGFIYYLTIKNIIKKIVNKENVVLIDAHTFKVEGYAAYKLKNIYKKIPVFITCHGTSFNNAFNNSNGRNTIKRISKKIDSFICVSEKIQRQLKSLNVNNTNVIYNGINMYEIPMTTKENNIVTVGGLLSVKNIDVVIESYKNILKKYKNTKLYIIGNGPMLSKLKEYSLGYKDIYFLNQLPNNEVYNYLNKNLIFLLPSKPEGFGISYVEAMYNGCITIGTKGEGIDGFIKNGINGFLINIDKNEISNLICEILKNPSKYNSVQENAIESAKKLTWENNAKKYSKLLGDKNV